MPMYDLIEYRNNYSKTLGTLWQYCRDGPALTNAGIIKKNYVDDNNSASFKLKQKRCNRWSWYKKFFK